MFSLGVCLYMLLCYRQPFTGTTASMTRRNTAAGVFQRKGPWAELPCALQEVVEGMLLVDPHKRWSLEKVLQHPWLQLGKNGVL